jgi:tetratricopeptide (TPR) repeat protein
VAHLEAIRHFDRGLATLETLPEGPSRDARELELQLARGLAHFAAKGFSAAEAAQAYTRARELAERRGDVRQLFTAVYGLWQSANGAGHIRDCRRLSNRLQQLAAAEPDDELRLEAHHSAWATSLFAGDPTAARKHSEVGRRLYDPERHHVLGRLYGGHDPGACAGYVGAQASWLLGYPEDALTLAREGLTLAERISDPFSVVTASLYVAMVHLNRGEPELALQRLATAESIAAEQRVGLVVVPEILRGTALTALGAFDEAVACLRQGLAGGPKVARVRTYGLAGLSEALSHRGEHAAALAAAKQGLQTGEETGHRQWHAELHRLEGVALLGLNKLQDAQRAFDEALRVARRQKAKAYELRAARDLCRLWSEQRRRAEARDLLESVYGWFAEGFDTTDLKEAKALLDELA